MADVAGLHRLQLGTSVASVLDYHTVATQCTHSWRAQLFEENEFRGSMHHHRFLRNHHVMPAALLSLERGDRLNMKQQK